jgi:hypothetical protein
MTEKAWVAPSAEGHEAERREQKLVLAYSKRLEDRGVDVRRLKLVPDGEHKPIFTDLYRADLGLLVEAKGTGERGAIRTAIGHSRTTDASSTLLPPVRFSSRNGLAPIFSPCSRPRASSRSGRKVPRSRTLETACSSERAS